MREIIDLRIFYIKMTKHGLIKKRRMLVDGDGDDDDDIYIILNNL